MTETFFDTQKRSFVDVTTEPGIKTVEFLEAAESLTTLFDLLGSTAFGPVKSDMTGNIAKIRARYDAAPGKSETLQDLTNNEIAEGSHTATQGLLWLNRGLNFTYIALKRNQDKPDEELSASFTEAYSNTLKQHHNFVVKGIFSVAMKATPYRAEFYKKLGEDQGKVQGQMQAYVPALEKNVAIVNDLFDARKDEWKWEKW